MFTAEGASSAGSFEIGVAFMPTAEVDVEADNRDTPQAGSPPGYEEAYGLKFVGRNAADGPPMLVVKGEAAVLAATDAIASQIGVAAQRIATAIEQHSIAAPAPGALGLDSVVVSFGITLSAGVQALFTAQAGSSVQVSVTLARQQPPGAQG